MAIKLEVPKNFGRWSAAVLAISLLLMVPWILVWEWIAGFELIPDVFVDAFTNLGLVFVALIGAHKYMRWHLRRRGRASESFPFSQ
jgi:hypothetical protein